MWDRKELKEKAKAKFRANRITCIFAALLLFFTGSFGSGGVGSTIGTNLSRNNSTSYENETYDESFFEDLGEDIEITVGDEEPDFDTGDSSLPAIFGIVFGTILLIIVIIGLLLGIFLLNPLQVGLRKFFIDNAGDPSTGLNRGNIGLGFGEHYKNIVGAMFSTDIFEVLWTLLLIVPGIIKGYEWRLVPYLLAENPRMSGAEARTLSAEMMYGSKADAFVLDLSFIGWYLVGAITLGIGNLVWTHPYVAATDTELYLALGGGQTGVKDVAADNGYVTTDVHEDIDFIIE